MLLWGTLQRVTPGITLQLWPRGPFPIWLRVRVADGAARARRRHARTGMGRCERGGGGEGGNRLSKVQIKIIYTLESSSEYVLVHKNIFRGILKGYWRKDAGSAVALPESIVGGDCSIAGPVSCQNSIGDLEYPCLPLPVGGGLARRRRTPA